jgi:hypothetical protein
LAVRSKNISITCNVPTDVSFVVIVKEEHRLSEENIGPKRDATVSE